MFPFAASSVIVGIVYIASAASISVALFLTISNWVFFAKAGKPGWGIFLPPYAMYLFAKIAGKSGWWMLLLWVPIVNLPVLFGVARNFGKGGGFAWGLLFFPFIFVPILAFGSAEYAPVQAGPEEDEPEEAAAEEGEESKEPEEGTAE